MILCACCRLLMLADAWGAARRWHKADVLTPRSNALIKEGIQLDRHYTYVCACASHRVSFVLTQAVAVAAVCCVAGADCSPARSSLLSGRLPYHVNQINLGGYYARSGIARNMTIIPRKLKQAGYATHMIGVR
eukprot:COSAG01_NODE_120_length_25409_cov_20.648572_10_plen_133_part_00